MHTEFFCGETPEEEDNSHDPGVDERILLE
jgi:hypothetical protein